LNELVSVRNDVAALAAPSFNWNFPAGKPKRLDGFPTSYGKEISMRREKDPGFGIGFLLSRVRQFVETSPAS